MPEAPPRALRVLVVDDEPGMRLTLAGILRRRGHAVEAAEDGLQAVEAARAKEYDLVFMDVKMPGITGVEAFVRLKALRPRTAVVLMTAYAMEEELARGLSEGAYTVVSKPFDMDRIWSVLSACADARPAVLVCDDRPEEGRLVAAVLEQKGYRVAAVQSGWDCLQALRERPYEVVLLDVRMPGLDGMETLRRAHELRPASAVVMASGYAADEKAVQAAGLGAKAWLRKPYEPAELLAVVERALSGA